MSLRTTYTGAIDAKLAEARADGKDWVLTDNLAGITSGLTAAANKGQRKFTLNFAVTYQPADLRLLGPLWYAYQSGIIEGLAAQDIMVNECVVKLNTSDMLSTSIDLAFSF
jgi:hypothetical protein